MTSWHNTATEKHFGAGCSCVILCVNGEGVQEALADSSEPSWLVIKYDLKCGW